MDGFQWDIAVQTKSTTAVSLGFVGDVAFNHKVQDVIATHGPNYIFEAAKPHFEPLDLVVGNLECSIVEDRGATAAVDRPLWTTPVAAAALRGSGIKVVTLANNHMMDCGPEGLRTTMRHLEALGIRYFLARGRRWRRPKRPCSWRSRDTGSRFWALATRHIPLRDRDSPVLHNTPKDDWSPACAKRAVTVSWSLWCFTRTLSSFDTRPRTGGGYPIGSWRQARRWWYNTTPT